MLKRKARKTVGNRIATTMTKVGEHRLHVELMEAGPVFWLRTHLDEPPKTDDDGMEFLTNRPMTWSYKLTRKQTEELFCDLARHLGYEIYGYKRPLNTIVNAYECFGKRLSISCYDASRVTCTAVISRAGAKRFVNALAEEFEWDLTG